MNYKMEPLEIEEEFLMIESNSEKDYNSSERENEELEFNKKIDNISFIR